MTPYYADDWLTVYLGDCREVMAAMEPESVHCVVTSPPYWGLRDYGTATWTGGDAECDHVDPTRGNSSTYKTTDDKRADAAANLFGQTFRSTCGKCGATRVDSQLGLEPTPEAYVEAMVAVFREVKRVLRKDGTVWLNLGDSYAAGGTGGASPASTLASEVNARSVTKMQRMQANGQTRAAPPGLKPKDLVGIPWRVAFALQADGWYLRSDIIWSKPNPMPESVTDRPTKAHEYVFLLSKSPRYFFDADAVREGARYGYSPTPQMFNGVGDARSAPERKVGSVEQGSGGDRNLRSVWNIATEPYPGAHFATFPRALVEPCIKAGSPSSGVVLDPFAGSGTTGLVAQSLSRRAVLIDLSADYLEQLMDRNRDIPLGLAGG